MLKVLSAFVVGLATIATSQMPTYKKEVSTFNSSDGEEILYQNDFSEALNADDILYEGFEIENGVAKNITNATISVPLDDSNDYSLSFDIKGDGGNFYTFFNGVANEGTASIRYGVEGNGAYIFTRLEDDTGIYDIYNNSGQINGGLNNITANLETGAHIEYKFIDGYSEVWLNNDLLFVTNLDNFGNLRYQRRKHFEESPLTNISFEWAGNYELDNFVWKTISRDDAKGVVADTSNTHVADGGYFGLPWGGEILNYDNYKVVTKFKMNETLTGDSYHRVVLGGLNNDMHNTTSSDADSYLDFEILLHEDKKANLNIYTHTDTATFINHGGDIEVNLADASNGEIILITEVIGEKVNVYINDTLVKELTFEELGFTKGTLQYVTLFNEAKNCSFENSTFYGFDESTGVVISAPGGDYIEGNNIEFNSTFLPTNYIGDFEWYLNGEATGEKDKTFVLENPKAGSYTVQLKSGDFESNVLTFDVADKLIRINSDKLTGFTTDTFEITSEIYGDFGEEEPKWYVDGEIKESSKEQLTLSNLSIGEHTVQLKTSEVESNILTITITQAEVEIEAEKTGFFPGENADFVAQVEGLSGDLEYSWYLDNSLVEGETESIFNLDTTGMEEGTTHSLYVEVGGIESDIVSFFIITDPLEKLEQEENWASIYDFEIQDGVEYGTFIGRKEGDRTYLEANKDGEINYVPTDIEFPSSTTYSLKMDIWVPETVDKPYYYYPVWSNMFGAGKNGETAVEIGTEGLRPYIKNQATGTTAEANLGKDLSYATGVSKANAWNTVELVMYNKFVAAYINGEMVMFTTMANVTYPSGLSFNGFPDGGSGHIPFKISNISIYDLVQEAPDLEQVRLTSSAKSIEVGQTATITAQLVPYNAEATTCEWYVNNEKVDGNEFRYVFTGEEAGTFKIHCVVDGIKSNEIDIEVKGASNDGSNPDNNIGIIVGSVIGGVVVLGAIGVGTYFVIKKKKSNK